MITLLSLIGCAPAPLATPGDASEGVVMTTLAVDYTVGSLSVVDPAGQVHSDVATVHADAVVRSEAGAVWVINRLLMDTVRRYEPGSWAAPLWETSVGPGTNPQDAALCGGELWVSRLGHASLLRLDPDDGRELGTVDLGPWADEDGLPEAADLVVLDGVIWVGLQRLRRLDGWSPSPEGRALGIDCDSAQVVHEVRTGPNPVLRRGEGEIVVLSGGGLSVISAGGVSGGQRLADVDGADVVDGAWGAGALLIAREGAGHLLACLDAEWRPTIVGRFGNFLSSVVVDRAGLGWVAARPGWEDPTGPSGVIRVDLAGCRRMDPEFLTPVLPPFSLAVLPEPR